METANEYFGKMCVRKSLKLGIFQLKQLLYTNSDPASGPCLWIYNTFWLEIQKTNIDLENLWFYRGPAKWVGFRRFEKCDFEAFSGTIFIVSAVGCRYTRIFTISNSVLLTKFWKDMFGKLGLNMRNHSNNDGTVTKRKFVSVCHFGLI